MKLDETLWQLRDTDEEFEVANLTLHQTKIVLLGVAPRRGKYWQAKPPGGVRWLAISDIEELGKGTGREEKISSPLLMHDSVGDDGKTLEMDVAEITEQRSARRYFREISFSISSGDDSFTADTVNASLTGMLLSEPVPGWMSGTFDATLTKEGETLKAIVALLPNDPTRTRLQIDSVSSPEIFREWLLEW